MLVLIKGIKNLLINSELNMDMEWDNFRRKVEFEVKFEVEFEVEFVIKFMVVFKVRFMVDYKMVIIIDWFVNFILFKVNTIKEDFIIKEYSG